MEKSGSREEAMSRVEEGRRAKIASTLNLSTAYRKVVIQEIVHDVACKDITLKHNF
jgi:hypothetical protein